jgi:DNA-directed RNA polymerase I and III subunit RPAC2
MAVLRKGLEDLSEMCDVVEEKFTTSRDEFNKAHPDRMSGR